MNDELLYNKIYEKTKECGRDQFIKLLMQKGRENQELKQDIKSLVHIINHNCLKLETTKEEYESLKRWQNK